MPTKNTLPSLVLQFESAARAVTNRNKRGYVGLVIRDAKEQGVHVLTNWAQIPVELGQENKAYIQRAFQGSDRGTPGLVRVVVVDPEETGAVAGGLKELESQGMDYVALPPDATSAEVTSAVTWVKARRAKHYTEKLVAANADPAPDDMGVINFCETGVTVGSKVYTAGEYASRIAGILAGVPAGMSATYAPLSEVTGVTVRTETEQNAAIAAGKLILLHDGLKAKIARGVNSMTTVPDKGREEWSKIKLVEGMDLVDYYMRTTIQDTYLGRYPNGYDNKCILLTGVKAFLKQLETDGVLYPGSSWAEIDVESQEAWLREQGVDTSGMDEQAIKEADTGSWVFLLYGGKLMDAMEDFSAKFIDN
ncbi:phage tail sheath C-terminal domain-containing protein [Vermiculatibacterium agrestimuris]|uniref:phage tail sheath C-terminal domain-containing protein n=1 Tax=Vermiculatibacterium agrestimuris TaxID=2941519 RepID=UPI00203DB2ED|nr:phage tail sheath C-terminal domain-containing protein [Vermiculatibacterium agrestimuris]